MTYRKLSKDSENSTQIYAFIDDDGISRFSCTEDHPPLQEWLAEGNTPLPVDPVDPWIAIREKRTQLIRDSDWTMTPGATVDQAQWSAYRQILRDLPQTYSNPEDVVWPTAPSTSGPNTIEE